ncbi:hypothetical protein AJ78_08819 [Emergomyces pasteurianus Ep9510]|uniref:Uncharacterized protein n=1 Tax=Emergomyces pasteurianus Ep9510 TaxID=1447872 RepID=A0A1J9Q149_9EURO|nr:hypothetical protein AJ78_08819 [Emergomyces pasteurianus Ep9510]
MSRDNSQVSDPLSSLKSNPTLCNHQTQKVSRSHELRTVASCRCVIDEKAHFNSDASSSHFPSPNKDIVSAISSTALERHTLTATGEALPLSIANNMRELQEISEVQRREGG